MKVSTLIKLDQVRNYGLPDLLQKANSLLAHRPCGQDERDDRLDLFGLQSRHRVQRGKLELLVVFL